MEIQERVRKALRYGQPVRVMTSIEGLPNATRVRLRPAITEIARAIGDAAIGDRDEHGRWVGELRRGHHYAATTALLATASLTQATRLHPIEFPLAYDLIPRLFPLDLVAFVEAWSHRFLANPKAWDRNVGIEAMFDWAQQGLIPAPSQHGAVLLLISQPRLWQYLNDRPVLIDTTLPLLFRVPGIKGASVAQRDETMSGPSLGASVIPRLVRIGRWTREDVLAWCDIALDVPRSEYELRWFHQLRRHISEHS